MTAGFQYDRIIKYQVTAACTEPLHIGSAQGDGAEVLVHPVDGLPFIQATSISGVFRQYYKQRNGEAAAKVLFGDVMWEEMGNNQSEKKNRGSKICFSDGKFLTRNKKIKMELRPRVKINRETETCDNATVQGSGKNSGQKFNMEYIGAGAVFSFSVYLYGDEQQKDVEDIFTAIHHQQLQFGGQKSNGCGYIKLDKLLRKVFNMNQQHDRELWMQEEEMEEEQYTDCLDSVSGLEQRANRYAYEILVEGKTEGELLVKSIAVSDYGKDAPDCMNIQNANNDYIVPGSSLKGTIRHQMETIADYLGVPAIVEDTFGVPERKEKKGKSGNICFFDTVVGNQKDNDSNRLSHRIHIDKFTGGVMQGGLFTEKNIFGEMNFRIQILDKNNPQKTCGLLLLALRDLAVGMVSVGGGFNVGKGFIAVKKMTIENQSGEKAEIDFTENQIRDEQNVMESCLMSVKEETCVVEV